MIEKLCIDGNEWLGHRVACRNVVIELVLEALEPLRIGAGKVADPYSPIDLPVLRYNVVLPNGNVMRLPVIPGSSLKGVLRTTSMVLAKRCGVEAHSGVAGDDCLAYLCSSEKVFDRIRRRAPIDTIKTIVKGFCPTCLLYGARSFASHLCIEDFVPLDPSVSTGVKAGVGINRRTGAAAQRVLYNVEYVEAGSRFRGVIRGLNLSNWMLSLLAASLLAIHNGWMKLGGFKSRGMGRVKIVEDSVKLVIEPSESTVLEVLDMEIDESIDLGMCRYENGRIVCSGRNGFEALQVLEKLWYERFCGKLQQVYATRIQNARQLCESYALAEETESE